MNDTRFRVGDLEAYVPTMTICLIHQAGAQPEQVIHQIQLKGTDVFPVALAVQKFFPRFEQIFQ